MDRYYVTIDGRGGFDDLSESQYFDLMNDLAIEFYRTGYPRPDQIHTEIKKENYGHQICNDRHDH